MAIITSGKIFAKLHQAQSVLHSTERVSYRFRWPSVHSLPGSLCICAAQGNHSPNILNNHVAEVGQPYGFSLICHGGWSPGSPSASASDSERQSHVLCSSDGHLAPSPLYLQPILQHWLNTGLLLALIPWTLLLQALYTVTDASTDGWKL